MTSGEQMTESQLPVIGHENLPVPNSFLSHDDGSDHLAIIFPGFAYGIDRPILHYSARLLTDLGADVLRLGRLYSNVPGFSELPAQERARMIVTDGLALATAGLAHRAYSRVTLVGKSIGTLTVGRLLKVEPRLAGAACIWHTPLLSNEKLMEAIEERRPRSFFTIGTDDPHYDSGLLTRVAEATGGESLVVEDADHSLEIPASVARTIDAASAVMEGMDRFMKSVTEE